MKKIFFLLIHFLPGMTKVSFGQASSFSTQASNTLVGKVTDSATGQPVSQASVFINKTSKGTTTRADGGFSLPHISPGRSELIISAIGYTTYVRDLTGSDLPSNLQVRLQQKSTELSAFTVEPYVKNGWSLYGQLFLDNFIGTTPNASSCKIKNKDVVRFHYSKKTGRLSVTANEPLIIENKALGYNLQYQLDRFSLDFNSHIVLYMGYPFFREMEPVKARREARWMENRAMVYKGSLRRFIRSLYADSLSQEGFGMLLRGKVVNEEKVRVKRVYNPSAPDGTYPMDTLHYFWNTLRESDSVIRDRKVEAADLVSTDSTGVKTFYFIGSLTVDYYNLKLPIQERRSELELVIPIPVYIQADGGYYPGEVVLASGHWGFWEKIANLVPDDYELPAPETIRGSGPTSSTSH